MSVPSLGLRELCWAAVVLGEMGCLSLAWVAVALLYDLSIAPGLLQRWGVWVEGAAWFTLAFSAPLALAVAAVLAVSLPGRAGFSSRSRRLGWHVVAALLGALCLAGLVARLNAASPTFSTGFAIVATAAWAVIFPMLYVPRLVVRRLGGLRTPATAATPR